MVSSRLAALLLILGAVSAQTPPAGWNMPLDGVASNPAAGAASYYYSVGLKFAGNIGGGGTTLAPPATNAAFIVASSATSTDAAYAAFRGHVFTSIKEVIAAKSTAASWSPAVTAAHVVIFAAQGSTTTTVAAPTYTAASSGGGGRRLREQEQEVQRRNLALIDTADYYSTIIFFRIDQADKECFSLGTQLDGYIGTSTMSTDFKSDLLAKIKSKESNYAGLIWHATDGQDIGVYGVAVQKDSCRTIDLSGLADAVATGIAVLVIVPIVLGVLGVIITILIIYFCCCKKNDKVVVVQQAPQPVVVGGN